MAARVKRTDDSGGQNLRSFRQRYLAKIQAHSLDRGEQRSMLGGHAPDSPPSRGAPMNRRQWLARSAVAAPALPWLLSTARAAPPPGDKLTPLKITDVKTFLTAPANIRLVVVKVLTNEPGLYGL